jgi:hypothetical protein
MSIEIVISHEMDVELLVCVGARCDVLFNEFIVEFRLEGFQHVDEVGFGEIRRFEVL